MEIKTLGIVRKLDELGRITLPIELRRTLDIKESAPVEIYTEGKRIILEKYQDKQVCCNCGNEHPKLIHAEHGNICPDCLDIFIAWRKSGDN